MQDGLEEALEVAQQVLVAGLLVRMHLDLVAGGQECVEADDELRVALEEHRDSGYANLGRLGWGDDSRGVDRLGFELLKL